VRLGWSSVRAAARTLLQPKSEYNTRLSGGRGGKVAQKFRVRLVSESLRNFPVTR